MTDPSNDPVDYSRTTRKHAGETMKDSANAPGLIAVAVGVVALVVGLFALATSQTTVGIVGIVIAVVLGGGGLLWLNLAHRRVRETEGEVLAEHPDLSAEPPTS